MIRLRRTMRWMARSLALTRARGWFGVVRMVDCLILRGRRLNTFGIARIRQALLDARQRGHKP